MYFRIFLNIIDICRKQYYTDICKQTVVNLVESQNYDKLYKIRGDLFASEPRFCTAYHNSSVF